MIQLALLSLSVILPGYFFIGDTSTDTFKMLKGEEIFVQNISQREITEQKVFGYSVKGAPIEGYVFGSGPETILLFSAIHGNEKGTAELLASLMEEIRQTPTLVSDSKRVVIIPVANPDGYLGREDKLNANEVNLNINFATSDWKQYGENGYFAGAEPFTEPESRIIRQVVEDYDPVAMISFHSLGSLVSPEENDKSIKLAKWYAEKAGYSYFDEWDYVGTATRWFVEQADRAAITIELSSHESSDWEINRGVLFELLASSEIPGIHN